MEPDAYVAAVDERLAEVLGAGARRWAEIIGTMQGADPVLVAERLRLCDLGISASEDADAGRSPVRWAPELHPLRAEWYFSAETASRLARRFAGPTATGLSSARRVPSGAGARARVRLLCLGAPTVAAACPGAVLVEREEAIARARFGSALSAVLPLDLNTARSLPIVGAHAAVVDPPWYGPHPERWFRLATQAVVPGGRVAIVLPPRLQRPEADVERERLQRLAARVGPTLVEPDAVTYDTPAFERIAMRAAGTPVPAQWRRADLLVVRLEASDALDPQPEPTPPSAASRGKRTTATSDPAPALGQPAPALGQPAASAGEHAVVFTPWSSVAASAPAEGEPASMAFELFTVGHRVIALARRRSPGPARITAVPRTTDFVWDRITRRDPRIASIDLWTSHSRVASVTGHAELRRALQALAAGVPLAHAVPDPETARPLAHLLRVSPGHRAG